jgi:sRNA-binding regulator protein Hfq
MLAVKSCPSLSICFDRFALIVEHAGMDHLIFKHAIATIRTPRSVPNYFSSHHP